MNADVDTSQKYVRNSNNNIIMDDHDNNDDDFFVFVKDGPPPVLLCLDGIVMECLTTTKVQ